MEADNATDTTRHGVRTIEELGEETNVRATQVHALPWAPRQPAIAAITEESRPLVKGNTRRKKNDFTNEPKIAAIDVPRSMCRFAESWARKLTQDMTFGLLVSDS